MKKPTSSSVDRFYTEYIGVKSLFYFCSLPIRLDSYRGCSHGCLYCFSQSLNNRTGNFNKDILPANPKGLAGIFHKVSIEKNWKDPVSSSIKHGVPIHFGCTSDPMQHLEKHEKVTLSMMKILRDYQYPYVMCTKSHEIAINDYKDLIAESKCYVQMSFSSFSNKIANRVEPHVSSPIQRVKALEKLSKMGVYTVARIQPYLFPLEIVDDKIIKPLANAGVKHVVLEHLRIPTNSTIIQRNMLWEALGFDLLDYYKKNGMKISRINYELDSLIKLQSLIQVRSLAHQNRMSFSSGDNEFHHFSDTLNCCGIPPHSEFNNYYKGHLGYGAFKAIRDGKVSFSYIDDVWHPNGSIGEYLNSHCRLKSSTTIKHYLKSRIDNPQLSNSPTSFFGIDTDDGSNYFLNDTIHDLIRNGGLINEN